MNNMEPLETGTSAETLATLDAIQQRVLWLATRMVHEANSRPNPDGSKVGGHQASSASMVTLMTALYFHWLQPGDRVSVKPHASPVFHAIQYLLGRLPRRYLTQLRSYKGLQAYPSRSKDPDPVDFSTGSVGLGAVAPVYAALAHQYAQHHFGRIHFRRFISLVGDAELDEGNVWETLLEQSLAGLGNVLWIVDLNRQSLDRVIPGIRATQLKRLFAESGWHVLEAKYGRTLQALFARPHGDRLRRRIDEMPNEAYQALIRLPGATLRERLITQDGVVDHKLAGVVADVPDAALADVVGNLAGHDLAAFLSVLEQVDDEPDKPTIIFAYTIKGWGLPLAGHPLNHSMLLKEDEIDALRTQLGVDESDEWAGFGPDSAEFTLCHRAAARLYPDQSPPIDALPPDAVPDALPVPTSGTPSTQQTFGRIVLALSREAALYERLVTASPDVAASTNLSGWIGKAGVYATQPGPQTEAVPWVYGPDGHHIELGISEMNLFMALGMFGLSAELTGQQLIPIGTVYDPFVCRGLDAFIYALYSGAKFIVAGTPSGITLAPEGGAHQSTITSSIGLELPNLNFYEPCFAQELIWIMLEALRQCCDRDHGRATYLRLSTKPIDQTPFDAAEQRLGAARLREQVLAGAYRLADWRTATPNLDPAYLVHIATTGAMVPEALQAAALLAEEGIPANVLHLTSPRRLFEAWQALPWGQRLSPVRTPFDWLMPPTERHAPIVTVNDGASHALSWLGSVFGSLVLPLGVDRFGQSGTRGDLYRHYGIDAAAIVDAALVGINRRGLR